MALATLLSLYDNTDETTMQIFLIEKKMTL